MNSNQVVCPDCAGRMSSIIGKLPMVRFFAGRQLSKPMRGGILYRCKCCDLVFRYPRLDIQEYVSLYDNEVTDIWKMVPLRRDQLLVKSFIEGQTTAKSVLDFGCYTGHFLSSLNPKLMKFGVEVNHAAAKFTEKTTNATVVRSISEFPPEVKFDFIVAMDVIEHFDSPKLFIASLIERLHPDGKILITTGDNQAYLWKIMGARWWYCYFPEHIAFVSRRWLGHHSLGLGFDVVHCKAFNYLDLPIFAQATSCMSFLLYLLAPSLHARLRRIRARDRRGDSGVPGAGLSNDHLFIALSKRSSDMT